MRAEDTSIAQTELGSVSLPSNPHGHAASMRVKATKQQLNIGGNSMEAIGLLVALEARPGKRLMPKHF
jgi:hypothetical protein